MESKRILITGASGNVGYEIVRGLYEIETKHQVVAADYNTLKAQKVLEDFSGLEYRSLDFSDSDTFDGALKGIDIVFLLRPPQLADIPRYFEPFLQKMKSHGISKIVFLSVQGVENQKMIPHYKLEKFILSHDMDYAFLRPGYFMQNLATTLKKEIVEEDRIFIPAGKLKLNWVDARDIGLVGAHILDDFESYKNNSYEITGSEFEGFETVAKKLSETIGREIKYQSPNLIRFFMKKKRDGTNTPMILVMIMLHWLPRFSKNKQRLTGTVESITGRPPIKLYEFIQRENGVLSHLAKKIRFVI